MLGTFYNLKNHLKNLFFFMKILFTLAKTVSGEQIRNK